MVRKFHKYFCIVFLLLTISAVHTIAAPSVVVYTSVDQIFSEPILKQFEQQTGIRVKAVYDVEAAKTVGLEKRLMAEKGRPQADVFWNSEYLRTLRLQQAGVLKPFTSPIAGALPESYVAPSGHWAGFGIRARVLVVNNDMVAENQTPRSIEDLTHPRWKGKVAIAKPYFGTTSTHFAAIYAQWGEKKYVRFLKALKANEVTLLPGNSNVRDAVVRGRFAFGLTDTDDVNLALQQKRPVRMVYPDQDGKGAFAIFHTVAKVANGPNPGPSRQLIDYLLSPQAEAALMASGAVQISVRPQSRETDSPKLWHVASEPLVAALKPSAAIARKYLE